MRIFLVIAMLFSSLAFANPKKEITLTKDNTLILNMSFSGKSVSKLIGEAKKMDADLESGYPIYLFLDTPGGSIQAGLELIEFLKGLNRPVHTVTLFAASMGWQLLQHLGDRYVLNYGILMSHKAYGGFRGEFGGGMSQIDSRYGLWLRRVGLMDEQTIKRTNGKKTLKQYQSEYDNELWLNGVEAVKNGYADEVVGVKCAENLNGIRKEEFFFFGFKISLEFDECPLRTYPTSIAINVRTNKGFMVLEDFLAKGGIFGKKCRKEGEDPKTNWEGTKIISQGKPAQLCLMDEKLTLEDLKQKAEEVKNEYMQKKRNVIKMDFANFASGM